MSITKKLLDFQKLGIKIEKDAENPHYKSHYSSLNEVLAKVKSPLNNLGILVVQVPEEVGLETRLVDTESNTEIVSHVNYVGATDMQKLGGAISYARRYALVALLGLEDEDDDGNVASSNAAPRAAQKAVGVVEQTSEPFII